MIARPHTFLLDENMPRKILSSVLKVVTQVAHLDISNRDYRLDPSGLEEEL